jgi:hypothetical protein
MYPQIVPPIPVTAVRKRSRLPGTDSRRRGFESESRGHAVFEPRTDERGERVLQGRRGRISRGGGSLSE